MQRGFVNDNVLHDETGDIHFSSYIPESYDGSAPYALFVTLPGWEGLYFQGVGANMVEDFGSEAIGYVEDMIILSPQLNDWGETSANMVIALTEYFLANTALTRSASTCTACPAAGNNFTVLGMRPELFTACLVTSSQWDGNLTVLAAAQTPVFLAIGAQDSYYGADSFQETYAALCELYAGQGLDDAQIDRLVVLDVREQSFFTENGFTDQHAGGQAFAHDAAVMGWLFGEH